MSTSATAEVYKAATPLPTNNSDMHPPTKFKDFTNPSGKKFKVNDLCEIDPLRPIEPEQLIFFFKWLDGKVENKNYINLKFCDTKVDWF